MRHTPIISAASQRRLWRDTAVFGLSVAAAVLLVRSGAIHQLLAQTVHTPWVGILIAGIGYSSLFTVAPATVALAAIGQVTPAWQVALVGGFGAMIGDQVVFRFIRSEISSRLLLWAPRLGRWVRYRSIRWPIAVLGALIVASPLPDEIGLSLLGLSHVRDRTLLMLTFVLNGIGIWAIASVGASLLNIRP